MYPYNTLRLQTPFLGQWFHTRVMGHPSKSWVWEKEEERSSSVMDNKGTNTGTHKL